MSKVSTGVQTSSPPNSLAPLQVYVTHCARTDSVTNTVGFGVRATSNADPAALKAADYPAYELPLDMWAKLPSRAEAPRRLARVRAPGGVLVVHSSFLEKDTMGRDRSYFTHALLLKSADPVEVLRSWAAAGWVTEYAPGAGKQLAAPSGLPVGQVISDRAVQEYLAGRAWPSGASLATGICPDRLAAAEAATPRRQLAEQFLTGLLLALRGGRERSRLYVHAEPGLLALLLYAAVRLLPRGYTADLTFTTYEPAQRGIKDFDAATVIGTYFAHPSKAFDTDLGSSRGYVHDMIQPHRSSSEIQAPAHASLRALLDLAAAGQWKTLDALATLCGKEKLPLDDLLSRLQLARALERVQSDPPTPSAEDLLLLNCDKNGLAALNTRREALLPAVLHGTLHDSGFGKSFANWFKDPLRCGQLLDEAYRKLRAGDSLAWSLGWQTAQVEPRVAAEHVQRLILANKLEISVADPAVRAALRSALVLAGVEPNNDTAVLFTARDEHELQEMMQERELPPKGRGIVLWIAFMRRGESEAARQLATAALHYLQKASSEILAEFTRRAVRQCVKNPPLAREAINPLLSPLDPDTLPNWDRLTEAGPSLLTPDIWVWLCQHFGQIPNKKNLSWLLQSERLARLLRCLAASDYALARWQELSEHIDLRSVLNVHGTEACVRHEMERARSLLREDGIDLARVLPSQTTQCLDAAGCLDRALRGQTQPPQELRAALTILGDSLDNMLQTLYQSRFAAVDPQTAQFESFSEIFNACYPSGSSFPMAESRVRKWLELSEVCPPAFRAPFQWHYVKRYVPSGHWPALTENPGLLFEADVVRVMREGALVIGQKDKSRSAPQIHAEFSGIDGRVKSPATDETPLGFVDAPTDSDEEENEEVIHKPQRSNPRRTRRGRGSGSPWLWILGFLLVLAVVSGVAAYAILKKKL